MIEIEKPRIETAEIKPDGTYGKFVVEPLERGFGTTLGNSLRRVLSPRSLALLLRRSKLTASSMNFRLSPV